MRRRFITAIAGGVILCVLAYWYWTGSRGQVPMGRAVSIDFAVLDQPLATITNSDGLTVVMKMLRSGRRAKPHDCTARGTMKVRFADGQTLSVAFAPGHELSRYEFGMDGHLFAVSRSRFLESLKAAGVDVEKIPTE